MSEQPVQTPDLDDFLGSESDAHESAAPEAPVSDDAPEAEAAEASEDITRDLPPDPEAFVSGDEDDTEQTELEAAAAAVNEARRVFEDARARYQMVAARYARKQREECPLHVQNEAVRQAQLRDGELKAKALENLAKLGFDPNAVNILAGGARTVLAPRKPHPPLFPTK